MDDLTFNKLWRVRRTVLQMLKARGYILPEGGLECSEEELRLQVEHGEGSLSDMYKRLSVFAGHHNDPTNTIMCFFELEPKISVKHLNPILEHMRSQDISRGILIIPDSITSYGLKLLDQMEQNKLRLEVFKQDEMMVNITEHELVPKHTPLSADEKKQLLSKYKLRETQLPRIMHVDPVAKFFGLSKGQIVKITRNSETAGRYVTYRVVM